MCKLPQRRRNASAYCVYRTVVTAMSHISQGRRFLLSIYDKLLEASDEDKDRIYQRALEVCDILITADTIRSTYWNYKKDKFQSKFGPDAATNLGS